MTYQSPTRPMAHQAEAWNRLRQRPSSPCNTDVMAWLMEMGTGKTKVVLDEWGSRVIDGDFDKLLVIAPAGSYRNWDLDHPESKSEISKHLDPALRVRTRVAAWESGRKKAREKVQDLLNGNGPRIMIMNVEALSSVEAARDVIERFIDERTMVCIDESTTIKNPKAKRTKFLLMIGMRAGARRIMTGLVSPKGPMDLFSQFAFLDPRIIGSKNFWTFRARYAVMQRQWFAGRLIDVIVGYRDIEDLNARIAPYSYRVLKEECLDLEPKVYMAHDVELTSEQQRMYSELRDFATSVVQGESHVTATVVITQILRLHQLLCGHVVDESGAVHDVPENRTAALLEILEQHSGKAVIWVPYRQTLDKIAYALRTEYGNAAVAEFHGGNKSTREDDEQRFKTSPDCRFMVATQGAGGRGNNWVVADLVVYFGNNYDLEQRSQSEDRCHRQGQQRSVTYVDLVARNTVDEKILVALRRKINLATTITGENYREWLI